MRNEISERMKAEKRGRMKGERKNEENDSGIREKRK